MGGCDIKLSPKMIHLLLENRKLISIETILNCYCARFANLNNNRITKIENMESLVNLILLTLVNNPILYINHTGLRSRKVVFAFGQIGICHIKNEIRLSNTFIFKLNLHEMKEYILVLDKTLI
jgi:hypothetical protein